MFTINIEKECGCFKKSDFHNNENFADKDRALTEALSMVEYMNNNFCQKHQFELTENGNEFSIKVEERVSSGCCGGGHCS